MFVTVDVESELDRNGSIANITRDENDSAGTNIISDVSVFFKDAEGSLSFTVKAEAGGQDFGNIVELSGNSLKVKKRYYR